MDNNNVSFTGNGWLKTQLPEGWVNQKEIIYLFKDDCGDINASLSNGETVILDKGIKKLDKALELVTANTYAWVDVNPQFTTTHTYYASTDKANDKQETGKAAYIVSV